MTIYSFDGDYRFLSNFHPCTIKVRWNDEIIEVPSVEHAYQATKCLNRPDFDKVCTAKTPGQAKRIGKTVVMLPDWDGIKVSVMRGLLIQKFNDKVLRKMLLDTKREELIEGNTWGDRFWGVCKGEGQNNLGKLLMDIRTDLFYWR
jgi:hypothetical protein